MAECQVIRRQLEAVEYEADALPASAAAHLTRCAACRDYAAQMQVLRAMLAEQPRVLPPATFDAEVRLRLGREAHHFRDPWLAWMPTPVLAALAVVAVLTSALAVRSSMQMVLHTPPTVADALTLPTQPERTLATAIGAQFTRDMSSSPTPTPRMATAPSRLGRVTPPTPRRPSPTAETAGIVVLWRGRSGERVMRLPTVVYGAQPVLNRRPSSEGESSDDSVF